MPPLCASAGTLKGPAAPAQELPLERRAPSLGVPGRAVKLAVAQSVPCVVVVAQRGAQRRVKLVVLVHRLIARRGTVGRQQRRHGHGCRGRPGARGWAGSRRAARGTEASRRQRWRAPCWAASGRRRRSRGSGRPGSRGAAAGGRRGCLPEGWWQGGVGAASVGLPEGAQGGPATRGPGPPHQSPLHLVLGLPGVF